MGNHSLLLWFHTVTALAGRTDGAVFKGHLKAGLTVFRRPLGFKSHNIQLRQSIDDFLRFQADGDDAQEQFERIARVVHGVGGLVVGVVVCGSTFHYVYTVFPDEV